MFKISTTILYNYNREIYPLGVHRINMYNMANIIFRNILIIINATMSFTGLHLLNFSM